MPSSAPGERGGRLRGRGRSGLTVREVVAEAALLPDDVAVVMINHSRALSTRLFAMGSPRSVPRCGGGLSLARPHGGLDVRSSEEDRRILVPLFLDQGDVRRRARLAQVHGCDNVFDFSIGNPNLEPPEAFQRVIEELVRDPTPGLHGYMSNAGYSQTRAAVADYLSGDQGVALTGDHVVMTCGAGGALNVILKTILDPGDEVIVPSPYFVEYAFYADTTGECSGPSPAAPTSTSMCRRSQPPSAHRPGRPHQLTPQSTGRVYPAESVAELGDLLRRASAESGRIIYLVSDEPYRRIVYDGCKVASVMAAYENTVIASSYSKELSLPGERIGFAAANPTAAGIDALLEGLVLANRILGFVNAPALMQRAVARLQGVVGGRHPLPTQS